MKMFRYFIVGLVAISAVACSNKGPQFTIEGKIADADSSVLYLEKRELSEITLLDSVKLADTKGEFTFKAAATTHPEFYVLRIGGQVINLAIDSTETIKVNASKNDFATGYTVEGSDANTNLKDVALAQYKATQALLDLQNDFNMKKINEQEYIAKVEVIANEYKDTAKKAIFVNLKSPAAYFALFQKVGGLLFFDPYDKGDYKIFAAVATAWDQAYKDTPRAKHLRDYTLTAMKVRKQNEMTIDPDKVGEVNAVDYYNIELPDVNGKVVSLASQKGKVVLLDFTAYQDESSPKHNIALNRLYSKFKPSLEIYQVSFDSDVHFWKNSASNLPWTTVHDAQSVNSTLISKFNVQALPTIYLLNKEGEIVKRLLPEDNVEAEIQKII